jgi:hypothetical protein
MKAETIDHPSTEADRLERLGDLAEGSGADWAGAFRPGSFGCHELLDRTAMIAGIVERQILDHPSCVLDPEWYALADRALAALNELYRRVGDAHVGDEPPEATGRGDDLSERV